MWGHGRRDEVLVVTALQGGRECVNGGGKDEGGFGDALGGRNRGGAHRGKMVTMEAMAVGTKEDDPGESFCRGILKLVGGLTVMIGNTT